MGVVVSAVEGQRDVPASEIRCVTTTGELASYERDWNRLVEECPGSLPFNTYAWMAAYFQYRLRPGQRWCCLLAMRGQAVVGVLPLTIDPLVARVPTPAVVASTPHDDHTLSVDALALPGREGTVLPDLVRGAFKQIPGCVRIDLPRLPPHSATLAAARRGELGTRLVSSPADQGAYLPVAGDFETFRGTLSRNFRNNIQKASNKLAKSGQVEFIFHRGSEAEPDDLRAFLEVEASSWKGDSGTAILRSPDLVAFYTTLTQRLAAAGWLEWQILRVDGRVVAANLAVAIGGRTVIWKLGYDEAVAKMSPGTLLLERVVRRAHEAAGARQAPAGGDSGTEINLLTNYSWYDNWEMQRRHYETLQIYAEGLVGGLLGYWPKRLELEARQIPALLNAARTVKRWLRR